jgi:magnesium-transporting ATPase (P-type)
VSTVKETAASRAGAPGSKPGPAPDAKDDLKSLPVPEVEKRLGSSPDGLTGAEAAGRLARYGPNEIAEKKDNPLLKLLTYFWGPIPWMIEAAVILSGVLRHWPDFGVILVLLLANAAVGFGEERQAGKAIDALKAQLAVKCRVRRDGAWVTPPSRELVPGDVIRMRTGDIVPADARLLAGDPVQVDQSALTGESLPVTAGPGDAVYSGSVIKQGEAGALVYATGTGTYFGKTAELVAGAQTVSHFQRAVLKIGTYLIILAVVLVAVITVVSVVRGNAVLDTLQFALVLTVAASIVLMKPGLSVIIDAVEESRKIFQRMNSYAIYRIAETLRVLLFVTLVILIFNFFPLTAVMIVMLALLNDGAILSIAYDNVHYRNQPEAWNMRLVLGIATVLGTVGPVAAFGLFYLGDRVFHLGHPQLQTMMYLMLSVAGHLTIFLARTRGPFWSARPARILLAAVLGTQTLATLIAVYGIFMTPLGWRWAAVVWGYAVIWFLLTDRVKLAAYRILDPVRTHGATHAGAPAAEPGPARDLPGKAAAGPQGSSHPDQRSGQHQRRHPAAHQQAEVQDLPPVDVEHPSASTAATANDPASSASTNVTGV